LFGAYKSRIMLGSSHARIDAQINLWEAKGSTIRAKDNITEQRYLEPSSEHQAFSNSDDRFPDCSEGFSKEHEHLRK
jgi:hypothetical protein